METKGVPTPARVYQDFEPSMEWVPEDDSDTLLVYLPGFAKEQLRVQLRSRNLIISGERKLQQNTWSRFRVEFPVSANCDLNKISAKFEGNILFVKQPKVITPAPKAEEETTTTTTPDQKDEQMGVEETKGEANGSEKKTSESSENKKVVSKSESQRSWEKYYKREVGVFVRKLKTSTNTIVVLVIGLLIGIYVSVSWNTIW